MQDDISDALDLLVNQRLPTAARVYRRGVIRGICRARGGHTHAGLV